MMRLLALDIGNTAVTYGFFEKGRLKAHGSAIHDDIPKNINNWSNSGILNDTYVLISSVVPSLTLKIKKSLRGSGTQSGVIGQNIQVPLRHRYRNIRQLGSDRILNIYGALQMHKVPLLILDFGTAITADYISRHGVFEGGMIIPGPEIAFQTLIHRAALLPKKSRLPKKSTTFLGRTSYDCMKSGILEGYGAMTDGLVSRFKARFGKNLQVLATGGFSLHLQPYTHSIDILDPLHSLKSLNLIFKNQI